MKMKQYLRGLATGIVIAVAVMSFFRGDQNGLSDEEIRERAAGLGMVMADSGTLSGGQRVPSGGETQESYQESHSREDEEPDTGAAGGESTDASDDGNGESTETEESSGGTSAPEEPTETQESAPGTTEPAESEQPNTGESAGTEETVVITIYPGDGSYAVARYLQQAGLVDDAGAYDKYLCDNGYDSAIRVGQVQIPAGSSYEEIAKLLTSRR